MFQRSRNGKTLVSAPTIVREHELAIANRAYNRLRLPIEHDVILLSGLIVSLASRVSPVAAAAWEAETHDPVPRDPAWKDADQAQLGFHGHAPELQRAGWR